MVFCGCAAFPQTLEVAGAAQPIAERPPTTLAKQVVVTPPTVPPSVAQLDSDGRAPISLGFAGDTSFHNGAHLHQPLREAAGVLSLPDLMVVNLETALAPPSVGVAPVDKRFLFRSDPSMAEQMAAAGIDAVSLANNHALDFGPDALMTGLGLLEEAGIDTIGAGIDADAAYKPMIWQVGEWTVGIAAFSRVPCDWSWNGENRRPQVAWACPAFMDDADSVVSALVEDVDLAVVMVHGGTEGQLCPDATMRTLNEHWAGLGADLVVNSHPHVLQGVTSIGETLVVNSLGNFAFPPSFGLSANSAVVLVTLSEQGLFMSMEPFVSESGIPRRGGEARRRSILNQVEQYSDQWRVLDDGRFIQDTGHQGLCAEDN